MSDASVAEMTNLLAVDANNILMFSPGASWLWLEGMQLLLTLGLLFHILGVAAFGGLAVCLLCFPVNLVVMRKIKVLQERLMAEKDERMKVGAVGGGVCGFSEHAHALLSVSRYLVKCLHVLPFVRVVRSSVHCRRRRRCHETNE